jgi:hypothetical protein
MGHQILVSWNVLLAFNYKASPHGVLGRLLKDEKKCVCDHEKNNEQKILVVRWEVGHFLSLSMVPMSIHVQCTCSWKRTC